MSMALAAKTKKQLRILDFDIENRPLSYWVADMTTAEVTAIAASWVGSDAVDVRLLGVDEPDAMLTWFLDLYQQADMVTGHYIRRHDLPILNGALLEFELPLLTPKLTSDTKMDLVRKKDLSASQEALAAMYGLPEPKHSMNQTQWREANRLTPEGIEQTRKRVVDDVIQHKALRVKLIEAKALKAPKMWKP